MTPASYSSQGIQIPSCSFKRAWTERTPKKYCVSFANEKFTKTTDRFLIEAKGMDIFDNVTVITERTIGLEYLHRNQDFISANERGFGYWLYKVWKYWSPVDYFVLDPSL